MFHKILVRPPRAELYADCDARFLAMIDAGETRYDEHAAELSRALILSHLEEN